MAHWAEINENNIVQRVVVTANEHPNEGYDWLVENFGGRWLKTSYNTREGVHIYGGEPFRGNYAGVGFIYDETLDAFLPPRPDGDFWQINTEKFRWELTVPVFEEGVVE